MNIDGKKYPNIPMNYYNDNVLMAKNSKLFLERIKNAKNIKIRAKTITGDYVVYEFKAQEPFDFQKLKNIK